MEILKTNEIERSGVTVLIYGDPGTGKTYAAGSLPEGKTLFLDAESGLVTLKGKKHDSIRLSENLADLKEIIEFVTSGRHEYENIVLDSASELEKWMLIRLGEGGKNDGAPELRHYQITQFKMRDYLRRLRDLRERGVNVVVTALEYPLELEAVDDVIRTKMYPMLSKRIAPEICGLFDIVGRCVVSQKEETIGERFILLDPTGRSVGKNRWNDTRYIRNEDLGSFILGLREEAAGVPAPRKPEKVEEPPTEMTPGERSRRARTDDSDPRSFRSERRARRQEKKEAKK